MLSVLRFAANTIKQSLSTLLHLLTTGSLLQANQPSPYSPSVPPKMKNIIILGGSYAGVSTAHRLLKQATKSGVTVTFKITLVSPNTHLYWNMASPRGILPGQFSDEQLFQPIAEGFKQYPGSRFEFILAYATALDVEAKTVIISHSGEATHGDAPTHGEEKVLEYDYIILATGTHTRGDAPFKGLGSTATTKSALHDFQARVEKANSIVIAGGGVTGVEVAGELAFMYGRQKEITLIASGSTILEESPASVQKLATKALQDLNVHIRFNTRATTSSKPTSSISSTDNDKPSPVQNLTLSLSDNTLLTTDMYIPTSGLAPNSRYISSQYINPDGFVLVDQFLNIRSHLDTAKEPALKDVWALGDVADVEYAQFISCDKQSIYVARSVLLVLQAEAAGSRAQSVVPYKPAAKRFMGLQIGRKAGTGHFGTFRVPSFVIVWARRNLFTERLRGTVGGDLF